MRSPEDLLRIGFDRSRVVIVNECHNGDQHCARTRHVGRRMLPVAHVLGVRHLAMEALHPWFAQTANRSRELPVTNAGYLGHEDLRLLMADALALGWELVAYECDFSKWKGLMPRRVAFANWRDLEEARNLTEFLARSSPGLRLLVWCGNRHQRKTPQRYSGLFGGRWIRMGQRLKELSGIEPFVIDQSVTVEYRRGHSPRRGRSVAIKLSWLI